MGNFSSKTEYIYSIYGISEKFINLQIRTYHCFLQDRIVVSTAKYLIENVTQPRLKATVEGALAVSFEGHGVRTVARSGYVTITLRIRGELDVRRCVDNTNKLNPWTLPALKANRSNQTYLMKPKVHN